MNNLVVLNIYDKYDLYHIAENKIVKDKTLTKMELLHRMAKGVPHYAFSRETLQYELLRVYHVKGKLYLRTDDKKHPENSLFISARAPSAMQPIKKDTWAIQPS